METKIELLQDDYEIHYTNHGSKMEFVVYEIVGWGLNKQTQEYNVPLHGEQAQESLDGIEPFWEGEIKGDGCSNWDFHTTEYSGSGLSKWDRERERALGDPVIPQPQPLKKDSTDRK